MLKRVIGLLAVIGLCFPLLGAVSTNSFVTPQTPKNTKTCFIQGTDTAGTYKTIYTGGSNGSKIVGIWIGNNDDVSHLATVRMSASTTDHCATNGTCGSGTSITITASAGYAASTPVLNAFSTSNWPGLPIDSDGNPYMFLSDNTQTIEATFATAFSTAGEHVCFNVVASDF